MKNSNDIAESYVQRCEEFVKMMRNDMQTCKNRPKSQQTQQQKTSCSHSQSTTLNGNYGSRSRVSRPCMPLPSSKLTTTAITSEKQKKMNQERLLDEKGGRGVGGTSWDGLLLSNSKSQINHIKSNASLSSSIDIQSSSQRNHKQQRDDDNHINFMQFDPMRTLQFLTLELKAKLKVSNSSGEAFNLVYS